MAAIRTKAWLSLAEMAALALPGMPGTKRGMRLLSVRRGWDDARSASGKPMCRRRASRGGGLEYHISLLTWSPAANDSFLGEGGVVLVLQPGEGGLVALAETLRRAADLLTPSDGDR